MKLNKNKNNNNRRNKKNRRTELEFTSQQETLNFIIKCHMIDSEL